MDKDKDELTKEQLVMAKAISSKICELPLTSEQSKALFDTCCAPFRDAILKELKKPVR